MSAGSGSARPAHHGGRTVSERVRRARRAPPTAPRGCVSGASEASPPSPRSASPRRATRSGASRRSRRSPTPRSSRASRCTCRPRSSRRGRSAPRPPPSSCSSTASSCPRSPGRPTCPPGLEVGALSQALIAADGADVERYLAKLAPFEALGIRRAQHGVLQAKGRSCACAGTPSSSGPSTCCSIRPCRARRASRIPRLLALVGEHAEVRIIETYAGPAGQVYFTNAVSEFVAGDRAIVDHYRVQRESTAAYHVGTMQLRTGRETTFVSHNLALGAALARNDVGAELGGEGGDTTLNGVYVGRRHAARGQPHDDRSRAAAQRQPRGLQGPARRAGARRVQRQDHRPSRRAEDRREADQQGAAPLGRGADQHEAAARDLRRRREVHARGDGRPARSGHAVLPARARAQPARRAGAAHPGLRRRPRQPGRSSSRCGRGSRRRCSS